MRTRIVSLGVISSMLCSSPAFAEDRANDPQSFGVEGMLIGSGAGILAGATAGVLACPEERSGFPFHESPVSCGVMFGIAGSLPGMLVGGLIGVFIPKHSAPTALLVPSTNGRDTASLHLLVHF